MKEKIATEGQNSVFLVGLYCIQSQEKKYVLIEPVHFVTISQHILS